MNNLNTIMKFKKTKISEMSRWASDLYLPINKETDEFIKTYEFKENVISFIDNIYNKPYYEIPFFLSRDEQIEFDELKNK